MAKSITDVLGRPLRDLRISVTDRCNFRCRYCMPEEIYDKNYPFLKPDQMLSFDEIARITRIFASMGVKKIRITGGEPLLRKDLPELIHKLYSIQPVQDISLTTNGVLLKKQAPLLKEAGLDRINVSLDTLRDETFARLNSRKYSVKDVLEGIEAAAKAGLRVKINMVVIKGINDDEIVSFARYFRGSGHIVRFIEYMDVGNSNGWDMNQVVSKEEIVSRIHAEMPVEQIESNYFGEVASRYRYLGSNEEFGVISSITAPFCSSCTRARLSSDGHLYTCLFASKGYNLLTLLRSGASDQEIGQFIEDIWRHRKDRYSEERSLQKKQKDNKIEMFYIGG
ncbi:GTP 3',8-cyclase MoaA [Thermoflavimicrobium dichotomicum]|uniref:GTP 3',8-cyclase n=1 Tax=Thermoflavimicrobium dichotomicum TaxID=46223 RepID=A0A1I3Q7H5_9BACL|nr:GTP 3',8-cyclase MoaA [Thermoflavimicrobium dichotomicum]SFJ29838.1 cyclic pyranopterin phosphate synthase [Thermoflavimicrobium dichotomicum]